MIKFRPSLEVGESIAYLYSLGPHKVGSFSGSSSNFQVLSLFLISHGYSPTTLFNQVFTISLWVVISVLPVKRRLINILFLVGFSFVTSPQLRVASSRTLPFHQFFAHSEAHRFRLMFVLLVEKEAESIIELWYSMLLFLADDHRHSLHFSSILST